MKKIFLASLISLFFGGLIGWFLSGFGKDISSFVFGEKYPDAPLGLQWGMKVEELESKAGAVSLAFGNDVSLYSLKSPLMPVPGITWYMAYVHKDYGLMRIMMEKKIKSDKDGAEGKKEYFEYKKALTNKYGKPTNSIESVEKDSDEFYHCSNFMGCSFYSAAFGDHLSIELKSDYGNIDKGRLIIMYESEFAAKHKENIMNEYKNKFMKAL